MFCSRPTQRAPNPTVKIKAFGRILQDRMDGEKKDPPFRMGGATVDGSEIRLTSWGW